ncbi:DNA repair helicase rad25 [Cladochytrium replicatum]|nr:DNA repair helicase rad25 [Cladochytrium replicatum]
MRSGFRPDGSALSVFESTLCDLFPSGGDHSNHGLKDDHLSRPLWISDSGYIYLEAFSPISEHAQDFLGAIAEPVSRPQLVHEYRLTEYSLYAAVSVGLDTESIIEVLNRLSKIKVSRVVEEFIKDHTLSYGKVKLVLKHNRYFLESIHEELLVKLRQDEVIKEAAVVNDEQNGFLVDKAPSGKDFAIPGAGKKPQQGAKNGPPIAAATNSRENDATRKPQAANTATSRQSADLFDDDEAELAEMMMHPEKVESVRKRCNELNYPLLEEYDFRNDERNPNLKIDLKPSTHLRSYQERALSKMFGNGRARSGVIVLPCGAGKTLVGVTAAATIRKSCLVLCTSSVSVEQWCREFQSWSTVKDGQVARFTAEHKEKFRGDSGILVSTYTMLAFSGKRAYDAQKMMDFIQSREWGFLLLDEVHVVPAEMFRKVLTLVAAHAKLGLTATLVREDDKIENLNYLIGPKLYEANWMDLASKGHIANVQCAEVWCTMTPEFYREYLREKSRKRQLLYVMNPRKVQACQYLMEYHEALGDKIIIFSDNVFALKHYAEKLSRPYLYGGTSPADRLRILQQFRHNPALNTIFLSKVGDTSIDIPEATCLIQISSHYGSRRQEAQRLGRILRAKRRHDPGFNAFFYTLVSKDTEEMFYASKRQQFLIDQGYAFRTVTALEGLELTPNLAYNTREQQLELLSTVLLTGGGNGDWDEDEEVLSKTELAAFGGGKAISAGAGASARAVVRKSGGGLKSLSGGDSMAYMEYSKAVSGSKQHRFFKKHRIVSDRDEGADREKR